MTVLLYRGWLLRSEPEGAGEGCEPIGIGEAVDVLDPDLADGQREKRYGVPVGYGHARLVGDGWRHEGGGGAWSEAPERGGGDGETAVDGDDARRADPTPGP